MGDIVVVVPAGQHETRVHEGFDSRVSLPTCLLRFRFQVMDQEQCGSISNHMARDCVHEEGCRVIRCCRGCFRVIRCCAVLCDFQLYGCGEESGSTLRMWGNRGCAASRAIVDAIWREIRTEGVASSPSSRPKWTFAFLKSDEPCPDAVQRLNTHTQRFSQES